MFPAFANGFVSLYGRAVRSAGLCAISGKRVLRLRATPHSIAIGFACGIFAAFIPILGVHIAIALAIAWLIGGNIAAAVIGTTLGNPLILPFIWAATLEVGRFVMTGSLSGDPLPPHLGGMLRHLDFGVLWHPLIEPMLIGAVPLGLAAAALASFPSVGRLRVFKASVRLLNCKRLLKPHDCWRRKRFDRYQANRRNS